MKRPPQLWLITVGILCLSFIHSSISLRATSLIFSKTTTTTSTTEAPPASVEPVTPTSVSSVDNNTVTKPPLTGIPQIDYKWDPNLPFELKNYNLSDYPFYDRVPDETEIDFKCDGLHDGFYASVPHKCQVYHHCLYGTRYDFLCANFTAFDQKTFICHFASEVDCINSPDYWHRNDALYQAASTTTPSTTTVQAIVTPAPALINRRPIAAVGGRRRRPLRRRRPQYEYYYDDEEYETDRDRDDDYDDPPPRAGTRRRSRPRPNRRPEYDEYDEYADERFERRGSGRRDEDRERRPYDRRGADSDRRYETRRPAEGAKNKDRRFDDDESDRRSAERRPQDDKKPNERRRPSDDRRADDDYDRRSYDRPRKPARDRYDDADVDRRTSERPRKSDGDDRRYRGGKDPKAGDDDKEERRTNERPRKPLDDESNRRFRPKDSKTADRSRGEDEPKTMIRPNSGSSVYDRPRAPPIIRRPVPLMERDKYGYKPTATAKPAKDPLDEEEYYDEYEDEPKPVTKATRKSTSTESGERRGSFSRPRRLPTTSRRPVDEVDEEVKRPAPKRTQTRTQQERSRPEPARVAAGSKRHRVVEDEYEDEYDEDKVVSKEDSSRDRERASPSVKESRSAPVTKVESSTQESIAARERDRGEQKKEPIVRIVKRPFLPSRGGNPFVARGLQPVGSKALDITPEHNDEQSSDESEQQYAEPESKNSDTRPRTSDNQRTNDASVRPPSRSSPAAYVPVEEDTLYEEDEFKPVTSRSRGEIRHKNALPRTTPSPKVLDNYRNPLDINENEYDVTLNDALNPTLPNLPVRNVPTGFSPVEPGYQRSRFVSLDGPALSPASSDFVYQIKQPEDRYNPYVTVQQLNYRHPSSASGQYYTTLTQ